jgi:hypothetical protein
MSFSTNEIASLAQKAARGAGFPPAQSEHFGRAAVHHLGAEGPIEALIEALADPADSPILRLPLLMEDVLRALPLAGPQITLTLQQGDAALVQSYARLLPIHLTHCTVLTDEDRHPRLVLTADHTRRGKRPLPLRIKAPPALVATLSQLASRTYVPASPVSRTTGAGAGNIDND